MPLIKKFFLFFAILLTAATVTAYYPAYSAAINPANYSAVSEFGRTVMSFTGPLAIMCWIAMLYSWKSER